MSLKMWTTEFKLDKGEAEKGEFCWIMRRQIVNRLEMLLRRLHKKILKDQAGGHVVKGGCWR